MLELIFGKWFEKEAQLLDLGVIKDKNYTISIDGLYEGAHEINYSRDKYALRGVHTLNQPEKIKILTVGGSTTDQRYIDDTLTWQAILEKTVLKSFPHYYVSNAGVDGQSTLGHIANFEHWFTKIPQQKPDFVFFYVGINDAFRFDQQAQEDALKELMNGPGKAFVPQRRFPYHKSDFYDFVHLTPKGA
jgi:hypothetical protein